MAFVVPQEGGKELISYIVSAFQMTCTAYLFSNNVTPANTHVMTHYEPLNDAIKPCSEIYTNAVASAAGTAYMAVDPFTITHTFHAAGDITAYGWYVTNGSNVILAERFSAPVTISAAGDQVRISNHSFRIHS